MKSEQLSDALDFLGEDLLQETDRLRGAKPKSKTIWPRWAAMAACLMLVAGTAAHLYAGNFGKTLAPPVDLELPMLTLPEGTTGGMGFEGYMAYDVAELVSANPWTGREQTLPVYRNKLTYDEYFLATSSDFTAMQAFLQELVLRLGLNADAMIFTDNAPDEDYRRAVTEKLASVGETVPEGYFEPTAVVAEGNGFKIEVDQTMTAVIRFDEPVSLPPGYDFTDYAAYEDVQAVAAYLQTEYADLLGYQAPQSNITGGDYNIYAQQSYQVEFFDGAGTEQERIVNFNFNRTAFYGNEEGKLYLIRIFRPDLSEKMGDYPLITPQQAQKLLLDGSYITTVPYTMPGKECIVKTELIYRTSPHDAIYLPYYRFYVEIPEAERNGLKTYGAYYVPAVEGKYIENMPLWEGSFNC